MAGPWDNVTLPGPPNGPAWAQAAAQLMGATQNSINSGANAFQGWQNFNYQQQQRDFFQNPQNQALLQDALDPKNNNPNKYGPIFQAMIKQGGSPSFQQLLPLLQRQQLIQQDLDQNNAPQPPSSGPATSTQGASPANIHGDFSQPQTPRIGYGTGEAPNINTLAANYNLPDTVLQRMATSVGASSPEDDLTPDQARVAQQRIADYVKRTSGGVQGGASPDRGGGNPVAQAGTGNQETPQGIGGSGAVSPRPTSGSGGFNPSSGAATPNVQPAQAPANAANPPSGAAAMVPPQFRDNPQAFADYLRKQADDLSRRSRLGELIGVPSKTAEDRAKAMNDRAKAIEEQLGKDVGQTEQQKNERSGVAGAAKRRELQQTRYDKTDAGIEGAARSSEQMARHLQTMDGILNDPRLFTGAGQANVNFLRQVAQNFLPRGTVDPDGTLSSEALRKVTAQNLQNQVDTLRADAEEMGGSAGRIMLAQIKIMQDAAQSPDSSIPALRYLTEIGHRAVQENRDIADLSRKYKEDHNNELDSGFDRVLSDYERKHPMLTAQEERNIGMVAAPRMPANIQTEDQARAWARQHGVKSGDPIRINRTYPAQYIHAP